MQLSTVESIHTAVNEPLADWHSFRYAKLWQKSFAALFPARWIHLTEEAFTFLQRRWKRVRQVVRPLLERQVPNQKRGWSDADQGQMLGRR